MDSYYSHLFFFLQIGLQLYGVTSWSFGPWSEPVVVIEDYTNNQASFFIMCQADVPLVKCHFKVEPTDYDYVYPVIDLSLGLSSEEMTKDNFTDDSKMMDIRYMGTGLQDGQCGASFQAEGINLYESCYHFGCRGANEAGEWHDMEFPRVYHLPGHLAASINPRQVVVKPGSDVSFLLKADAQIRSCAVFVGGLYYEYYDRFYRKIPEHFRNDGTSPLQGECGITVLNVTEADNGPMVHTGWATPQERMIRRTSTLIVASPPTETYFNVDKLTYSVGETLNATCSSLLSRPVANLTWTLNGRIIIQDAKDDEFQEDVWSWSWEKQNITQKISLKLEEEHFEAKLECIVQHLAMSKNLSYSYYLIEYNKSERGVSWLVITISVIIIIAILSPLFTFKKHFNTCYLYFKSIV